MKIINMTKDENHTQWTEKFVEGVIRCAGIKCEKVVIDDIESDKRIFLHVDGAEYDIRMWSYRPVEFDLNNMPCAEAVDYTLFRTVQADDGGYGDRIDSGCMITRWKNECVEGTMDSRLLIHPTVKSAIDEWDDWREQVFNDFISREDFVNHTGIFVTPSYFSYIYEVEWKVAQVDNISLDDFLRDYEKTHIGEVLNVPLSGIFKCCLLDDNVSCLGKYDDCSYNPNIWEMMNCLALNDKRIHEMKIVIEEYRTMAEEYKSLAEELVKKLDTKDHLVEDLTTTYNQ